MDDAYSASVWGRLTGRGRIAVVAITGVWAAVLASPVDAALHVQVGARAGGFGESASYDATVDDDIIYAKAFALQADDGDGNARAEAGPGALCDEVEAGCVTFVPGSPALAGGGAEADSDGSLRVRANALNANTSGGASASLTDTVTFLGSQVVNFRVEVDSILGFDSGFADVEFTLATVPDPSDNDDRAIPLARFYAWSDRDGSGFEVYRRDNGDLNGDAPLVDSGFIVPLVYNLEFDFASLCDAFCQLLPGPKQDTFEFTASLAAGASVFSDGRAAVNADRSLHILPRDQVISASGYTFVVTPVPLPATGWLFGAALAGLAGRLVTRRDGAVRYEA